LTRAAYLLAIAPDAHRSAGRIVSSRYRTLVSPPPEHGGNTIFSRRKTNAFPGASFERRLKSSVDFNCGLRRRTGLNTKAKFTIASLAFLLNPLSPAVEAASQSIALQVVWGAASTGQRAQSAVKEADDLLDKAREAMDESNFELADSYITRAERLAPKYGMFHLGDTPKKAREDLQKRQSKSAGKGRPGLLGGKDAPQDPFSARSAADLSTENRQREPAGATGRPATRGGAAPVGYGEMLRREQAAASPPAVGERDPQAPGSAYGPSPAGNNPRWPAAAVTGPVAAPRSLSPAQGNAMNQIVSGERNARSDEMLPQAGGPAGTSNGTAGKQRAIELARQARAALVRGDLNSAEELAMQAHLIAPDSAFGPADDRPGSVLSDVRAARARTGNHAAVVPAGGAQAAAEGNHGNVVRSIYDPANDRSRNIPAQSSESSFARQPLYAQNPASQYLPSNDPGVDPTPPGVSENGESAQQFLEQGKQALAEGNPQKALSLFQQAQRLQDQLDPQARASLQTHLQILSQPMGQPRPSPVRPGNILGTAADSQQALAQRVSADVTRTQMQAKAMLQKDPKRALEMLQQMRHNLETLLQLDPTVREMQIKRIELTINETQRFLQANAAQIALDEQNQAIEKRVDDEQQQRIQIDDRLAAMVDEFNKLVDEQRYAEAEVVAKKARAMDPENPVVVQLTHTSKVLNRLSLQQDIYERKGEGFVAALTAVEESSIPGVEDILFPNATVWDQLTKRRQELEATGQSHYSERERQIEQALKTPVLLKYDNRPLHEVIDDLQKLANINIFIDQHGLNIEGQSYDTPVSINLTHEISLKSALQIILEPLRLNYVIRNDVLNITSGETTNSKVYTKSYPFGDLIIPIPNFVPDGREGISAALDQSYRRSGYGASVGGFGAAGAPAVFVADGSRSATPVNPSVNAQWLNRPDTPPATGVPQQIPFGAGPGGLAGGSQADFDSLIDLITSTIAPTTWDSAGGLGSVQPFETNLTLVVSQTQEVHEQIADLLQQLRRLQDLQVTIEVRFIDLSDNFFERIGVDFDFNIDDNYTGPFVPINSDFGPSGVIGLDPVVPLTPTPNLDLQFRQGSFNATLPNLPGTLFDPSTAGTFGFAILSDIEAFFLIQAAQGDDRSNILQAPKITLFNGQTAFISDTTQRPFVTSIIPVVGDFAAAQQPVIVVLSEGTSLSVQAVVSNDRRFVRLTLVPFFSNIGEVEEFTFTGSKTTSKKSSDTVKGKGDDETSSNDEDTVSQEGTTVQLPTFSFVTVTSTVSVPDGGTVLLGGIKRLSENRAERGLPILSKIPYINRLFKNVGLARATRSLMMMVTPRIIIQEEEEEKLIGTVAP
jgi:general secretion pathway protein D